MVVGDSALAAARVQWPWPSRRATLVRKSVTEAKNLLTRCPLPQRQSLAS